MRNETEVTQLCPTFSDPMGCRLPGSSIHGIFQARTLEWVAISFSNAHTRKNILRYVSKEDDILEITMSGRRKRFANIILELMGPF